MTLLQCDNEGDTLVIVPHQNCNIGRFFSGVNNHHKKKRNKQNCMAIRFNIQGQAHVLIYAYKTIKAGDVCYIDYNQSG